MTAKLGQIVPFEYEISKQITSLASRDDVRNIVEIGTWNGMGSTKCVLEGLKNKTDYMFKSYECWVEMFQEAVENNKELLNEKFQIIKGKIVNESEITDWFDIESLDNDRKQWLKQDLDRMAKVPNVFDTIPDTIDLLILDGGEFSTYKEWLLLKDRTNYVVLDDTKELKTRRIRQEIIDSSNYKVLADCLTERNGFMVGKLR